VDRSAVEEFYRSSNNPKTGNRSGRRTTEEAAEHARCGIGLELSCYCASCWIQGEKSCYTLRSDQPNGVRREKKLR
jgi:hypothetical protein